MFVGSYLPASKKVSNPVSNNKLLRLMSNKLPIRWTVTFDPYTQMIKVSGHIAQRTVSLYAATRKEVSKCKVEIAKALGHKLQEQDAGVQA